MSRILNISLGKTNKFTNQKRQLQTQLQPQSQSINLTSSLIPHTSSNSTFTIIPKFVTYGTATIGTASCSVVISDMIHQSICLSHTGSFLLINGSVISIAAIFCSFADMKKSISSRKLQTHQPASLTSDVPVSKE